MLQLLARPRWQLLAVLVVLLSVLFVLLGRWQWHRHEDRRERNAQIEAAAAARPVPLAELLTTDEAVTAVTEYRLASVSGTYAGADQLLQRNPDGRSGFEVLTPLVTAAGSAILVDRGWTPPSSDNPNAPVAATTPTSGQVDVVVRLRQGQPPDGRSAPSGQVYRVDPDAIGDRLSYPIYDGYGELVDQAPPPSDQLELPTTNSPGLGPHLFYAYQWWAFAVIAVAGYVVLLRRESTVRLEVVSRAG